MVSINTWRSGNWDLSFATHSMPLMPGRLMSTRATSGRSRGIFCRASSAVAQAATQRRPCEPLSNEARLSRSPRLSSTKETVTGMAPLMSRHGFDIVEALWLGGGDRVGEIEGSIHVVRIGDKADPVGQGRG